jgi:hypothetical protein
MSCQDCKGCEVSGCSKSKPLTYKECYVGMRVKSIRLDIFKDTSVHTIVTMDKVKYQDEDVEYIWVKNGLGAISGGWLPNRFAEVVFKNTTKETLMTGFDSEEFDSILNAVSKHFEDDSVGGGLIGLMSVKDKFSYGKENLEFHYQGNFTIAMVNYNGRHYVGVAKRNAKDEDNVMIGKRISLRNAFQNAFVDLGFEPVDDKVLVRKQLQQKIEQLQDKLDNMK